VYVCLFSLLFLAKKDIALLEENSKVVEAKLLLLHRCIKIFQALVQFTRTGIEGTQVRSYFLFVECFNFI
jgi:hypothetical protein